MSSDPFALGEAEVSAFKAILMDPVAVHVNMLRGNIARITMRQCAHVHGEAMVAWLNRVEALEPPPTEGAARGGGHEEGPLCVHRIPKASVCPFCICEGL